MPLLIIGDKHKRDTSQKEAGEEIARDHIAHLGRGSRKLHLIFRILCTAQCMQNHETMNICQRLSLAQCSLMALSSTLVHEFVSAVKIGIMGCATRSQNNGLFTISREGVGTRWKAYKQHKGKQTMSHASMVECNTQHCPDTYRRGIGYDTGTAWLRQHVRIEVLRMDFGRHKEHGE